MLKLQKYGEKLDLLLPISREMQVLPHVTSEQSVKMFTISIYDKITIPSSSRSSDLLSFVWMVLHGLIRRENLNKDFLEMN